MLSLAQQEGTMPELPEVEVTRQGLLKQLPGSLVVEVSWSAHQLRVPIPRTLLKEHIEGNRIRTIDRRAKYLLIRMEGGAVVVMHLGMTGKLGLIAPDTGKHKHDHLCLRLDNGLELRFNDSRRFGSIGVWPARNAGACEQIFSEREGIEPLGREFNQQRLLDLARGRKTPVKILLMNSRIIAGIGNIYANEILFAARIHPLTPSCTLLPEEWVKVIDASVGILQRAIDAGGSTISDFLGVSGHPGYFQLQLQVYGRKGLACPHCSDLITKTTMGGRATYFCPQCQPLPLPASELS